MDIYLKQEKFHQLVFRRYFVAPLLPEEITIRKFLCYYQELACKEYFTEAKLHAFLGHLYDAKFQVYLTNYGSYSLFVYSLSAVEPLYVEDDEYTIERLEEAFESLVIPKMGNHQADFSLFQRAYEIFESDLLSLEENTASKAYQQAIELYFKGTNREFNSYGNLTDLKKIQPKDVYLYYKKLMTEESISIGTGNLDKKSTVKAITLTPKTGYHFKERGTPKPYIEKKLRGHQGYLTLIYETGIYADDPLYYACMFLNHILGGTSSSYLFQLVREKYGLCYSIHSTYLGATGIIVITCVLDPMQVKKGLSAIEEAILEILKLQFSLEEIQKYYISNHNLAEDYIDTAIQNYISDHYFLDTPKSFEEVNQMKKVSKEDILKVYQGLNKAFVYVLGGKINEK
ncbi:MAG: insulinase family protein [Anaeroplasmataceae bacterium]|nr:insulinase family protein [Anaeroplasmataceae bacterium]